MNSGISGRLAQGATWIAASRIVISLIGLANTLVLARLLVPEDFGLVAIAMSVSAIVLAVTELSLAQALVQHKDPTDAHYNTALTLNMMRSAVVGLIVLGLSFPAAAFYDDPRLVPLFGMIAVSALIIGAVNPKLAAMSRGLVFWQEFATRSSEKFAGFVVALIVALIWQNYWALMLGVVAGQLASMILSYVIIPFRPRLELSKWRELMSFSIWIGLSQAVNTINWNFDQLVLGYFLGNTKLGYYSVGDRLAILPTREATKPVASAVFPGFAKLANDPPRLRKGYQRAQSALTAVALPIGIGFAVAAEPLVLLAMGEQWLPSVMVIQFLASVFAVQTLATTVEPLAMGMGASRILFNRSLVNFAVRVPLTLIGLLTGGLVGLLIARCVSGLIGMAINMFMVQSLLNLSFFQQLAINVRSLTGAAIMALAAYLAGLPFEGMDVGTLLLKTASMTLTGAVVYPSTVFLLWRMAGRPEGPEHDALKFGRAILSALRRRIAS